MPEVDKKPPVRWVYSSPIWLFVLTLPFVGFGSYMATTTFENDFARWPAGETDVRQEYDQFQDKFESTDTLIVSWPECQLNDARLSTVADELKTGPLNRFIDSVSDGASVYEGLRRDLDLSHKRATQRLTGSFLGPDQSQTCLYLALNREGTSNRYDLLEGLTETLQRYGIKEDKIKLAGPAYNMHSIDMEGFWSPLRAVPLIALFSFLLTWYFVKRLTLAMFISGMSGYTGALALTIVYLSGYSLNALVWTMPSLVLLLTTSTALHFLGYYRQAVSQEETGNVHHSARAKAWRPIAYCAATTAVGLFSLMLSNMTPVRQFGAFGGISVLASAGVVLSCLPIWLSWFPYHNTKRSKGLFWKYLARFTMTFRWPIIVSVLALGTYLLMWIPGLQTSARISNFFPESSKVVRDSNWLDKNVGPHSTIEMVLTFSNPNEDNDVSRIKLIEFLQRKYIEIEAVTGSVSTATYAPSWPKTRKSVAGYMKQHAVKVQVRKIKEKLVEAGLISLDPKANQEAWRISLRVDETKEEINPEFVEQLEKVAFEIFADAAESHFPGETMEVMSTGQAILLDYVETQFLRDLVLTYATAFVLISLVILLIMRNLVCVCIATPPNLIPAALVLGSVASAGFFLDVGSLMTASVALGIAVDDTLHFVLWWRERVRAGLSNHDAIVDAMKHCGLAMLQTTIVCGLSIALYAFCGFLPTVRFGLLLSGMLFAAIVGDLLLLPALLSTRIGQKAAGYRLSKQLGAEDS